MQPEEWEVYTKHMEKQLGDAWRGEALERLLILTARYGYSYAWSKDPDERQEQEERLALHNWARSEILKPTPAALAAHVTRLCACLHEAVGFALQVSPDGGHNAGMWLTAILEAQATQRGEAHGNNNPQD